jgi:WD40 repeat protein
MIHVSFYVIPDVQQTVICHEPEGKITSINLSQPVTAQTVFFNLLKREEGHLSLHKQMNLTANNIKIEFSQNGNYLAILIDKYQFSLYEVNENAYHLMKQIKKEQKVFAHEFDDDMDNIVFSKDGQFLALWSNECMNLVDIKNLAVIKNFLIDFSMYSQLLDVTID